MAHPAQLALLVSVSGGVHCPGARYLWNAGCPAALLELKPGQRLHTLDAFARPAQTRSVAATGVTPPGARVVCLHAVASATMAQGEEESCSLVAGVADLHRS